VPQGSITWVARSAAGTFGSVQGAAIPACAVPSTSPMLSASACATAALTAADIAPDPAAAARARAARNRARERAAERRAEKRLERRRAAERRAEKRAARLAAERRAEKRQAAKRAAERARARKAARQARQEARGGTRGWRNAPIVTWYGPGFYGNRTACGVRYTRDIVGVAHRTLPCGTLVEFKWHGITAVAPVIDRGPFASSDYVFDFSAAMSCEVFKPRGVDNACFTRYDVKYRVVGKVALKSHLRRR
jgi:rare lipoprotein A (peptidoglycan hydrolase)